MENNVKLTVIDADTKLYSVGWACEEESLEYAKQSLDSALSKILWMTEAEGYAGYLTSSSENFRIPLAVTAPYKGNRAGTEKPKHFKELRQHMIDHWQFYDCHGIEADDAIIIFKVHWENAGYDVVIASSDKDSLQEPGTHFNSDNRRLEFIEVSEEQAQRNFYGQMITGDAVDNIKGLSEYVNCDNVGINGTRVPSGLLFGPTTSAAFLDPLDSSDYFAETLGLYCDMYAYRDIIDGGDLGDAGAKRFYENWDLLYMLRDIPEGVDLSLDFYEVPESVYDDSEQDDGFHVYNYDEED